MKKPLLAFLAIFILCVGLLLCQNEMSAQTSTVTTAPTVTEPTATATAAPTVQPTEQPAFPGTTLQKTQLPASAEDPNYYKTLFMPVNADFSPNQELQKYRFGQVDIQQNHVLMTADKQEDEYISGKVESVCSFLYGSITYRINTMRGNGLFPAVWMLPATAEQYPEVDIYELIGNEPERFYGVLHYQEARKHQREFFDHTFDTKNIPDSYVIRFDWTPDAMVWYLNDKPLYTITENVPQMPMYLIMNLAVGGKWAHAPTADTTFPSTLDIEILEFKPGEIYTR